MREASRIRSTSTVASSSWSAGQRVGSCPVPSSRQTSGESVRNWLRSRPTPNRPRTSPFYSTDDLPNSRSMSATVSSPREHEDMTISNKDAAAVVCRRAFGSMMTQQGRGYYVTLELLAIVWGTNDFDGTVLPTCEKTALYNRRSHDFARRLMAADPEFIRKEDLAHLSGKGAPAILEALLASLRVPIPGRRKPPDWPSLHLYPYVGELIHYDATVRPPNKTPKIERYLYRGAGGLAHKLLRCDPDQERLEANRVG